MSMLFNNLQSAFFQSATFQPAVFQSCKSSYPSSTSRSSWRALISRRSGGVRPGGGRLVAGGRRRGCCRCCWLGRFTINVPEVDDKSSRIMMRHIARPTQITRPHRRPDPARHSFPACLPPLKLQILPDGRARRSTETAWPCGFVGGTASRRRPLPAGVLVGNWTSSERNVISYVPASRGTGRATS